MPADRSGTVSALEDCRADFSDALQKEAEHASRDAAIRAWVNRSTVERAKGILSGYLRVDSEAAFRLLVNSSRHTDI